ncbi:MAG: LamG-like jellyroll fold domain-containing protein [Chloroflexota bacterium]
MIKRFIGRASLLLLGVLLPLLGVEYTLRALDIPPTLEPPAHCRPFAAAKQEAYRYNQHGSYPPNFTHAQCKTEFSISYSSDSLGYLGVNRPVAEPRSLLIIGDSFAFGYGVEQKENFASRLNAYNAGLWGRSFPLHAQVFEQIAPRLSPEKVIWIIYPNHLVSASKGGWQAPQISDTEHPFFHQLIAYYNQTHLSTLILQATGIGWNRPNYYTKEWALYDNRSQDVETGYQAFETAAQRITEIAATQNINVYPVLVPSKKLLEFKQEGSGPGLLTIGRNLQADLPTNRLKQTLTNVGIPAQQIIDLEPLFRDNEIPWRELYYIEDVHWNTLGHGAVADYLSQALQLSSNDQLQSPQDKPDVLPLFDAVQHTTSQLQVNNDVITELEVPYAIGYTLNGADQYLSSTSAKFQITGSLSIGAWVSARKLGHYPSIMSKGEQEGKYAYGFEYNHQVPAACFRIVKQHLCKEDNYADSLWHFVVGVYDQNTKTAIFYYDGQEVSRKLISESIKDTSTQFLLGRSVLDPKRTWPGTIAAPFVLPRALSEEEVETLFNLFSQTFPS